MMDASVDANPSEMSQKGIIFDAFRTSYGASSRQLPPRHRRARARPAGGFCWTQGKIGERQP
jgi:hypothetical protein